MARRGNPPQGAGTGGGGGFSTKAATSGRSNEYVFDQSPGLGGKLEATNVSGGSGDAFVEQRSDDFAGSGVPTIDARGEDFEDVLGPSERGQLYFWERDLSSQTAENPIPTSSLWGVAWDGSRYVATQGGPTNNSYLYTLDTDFNVTGGQTLTSRDALGIAWDGTNFTYAASNDNYIYQLDTDFNVTGGRTSPAAQPRGVGWDGSQFTYTDNAANYIYILDSDLNVTGGASAPGPAPKGITWDGTRWLHVDGTVEVGGYTYVLDGNLNVTGGVDRVGPPFGIEQNGITWDGGAVHVATVGSDDHIYEFAGSYDFMAGLQE